MTTLDNLLVYLAVFGFGGIVLFALTKLVRNSVSSQPRVERRTASVISIVLWGWAILAVIFALSIGLSFQNLIPMLVVPWFIGVWFMFSTTGSNVLREIPVHKLISLSVYRIAGFIFIYCYYYCGMLSRGFALNAGWGDVLTGVLAIPTALMVHRGARFSHLIFIIWTAIGIGDLILAPASAAIYGAEKLTDFPINVIPLFLGPPFGILLHLITARAYWLQANVRNTDVGLAVRGT
ncbi:MAG: hypothetical protein AAFV88_25165 [Planctomycetota bacterium]